MRLFIAVAVLLGLAGCASAPAATVPLSVAACPGAVVDLAGADTDGILDVRAAECRSANSAALLSEQASFALLGAAAWRSAGPPADIVHIVVGRSADWSVPRSLSRTAVQATEAWGPRPVVANASTRSVRASATSVLWICGFGAAAALGVIVLVALVRAARRGEVVFIWWFR